ncbi:HNH endonuclease signature motif containing protein [Bacillus cereus group sp. Bc015]|uniref:HNH endonuclease n=1 Tax=Bacillus cereus group sp. Bc015 TaxID=3018123 RepID=UPI0022E469EA|nr:HNH endonuclease signature motif containing protein [Bacillus cereus group sp. Bc015]MDA2738392.1 HNH endonuclease signature motif containing protein [Bacillus cereus group sp. Bc015]
MENTRKWFEYHKHSILKEIGEAGCVNCGSHYEKQLHHIVPLALGGTNNLSNICVLCGVCHAKVHDRKTTNIRELTIAGQKRAKEKGVKFGRPRVNEELYNKAIKIYLERGISVAKLIEQFDNKISEATFFRRLKEYRKKETAV